jgi:hypothetical protein
MKKKAKNAGEKVLATKIFQGNKKRLENELSSRDLCFWIAIVAMTLFAIWLQEIL